MDDRFTILVNGKEEKYDAGTTYEEIARAHQEEYDAPIILANVNGKLCELHKSVNKDCTITFDTIKERTGFATYRRSALFMMIKAIRDVVGKENFKHVLPIDATELALDAGSILALNMVLLGAVTADDNFPLSKESVIDAMKNNLKPKFHDMNLKAIENGYNSIKG